VGAPLQVENFKLLKTPQISKKISEITWDVNGSLSHPDNVRLFLKIFVNEIVFNGIIFLRIRVYCQNWCYILKKTTITSFMLRVLV